MTASMNPALRDFWARPSPGKVLYGGRMSSKSWDAAANAVRIAQAVQVRVLCTRMFQNKIEESVYNTIRGQANRFGVADGFEFQRSKIKHNQTGSEFIFYGLARHTDEIKSLEGIDILWIEEAHALTAEMWEILEPTIIRNAGAEVWIVFNPRLANDFSYQRFVVNPPKGYIVRKINYDENPYLPQSALDKIEEKRAEDEDDFNHIYLGDPRTDDDKVIIKRSWLNSCIDAHIKLNIAPSGMRRVGFDIADDGDDLNATATVHGQLCIQTDKWRGLEDELLESCSRAYATAKENSASIDYDCIGVGAFAGGHFRVLNEEQEANVDYRKYRANGAILNPNDEYKPGIINKDHFENLKAQAWFDAAHRIVKTHVAITKGHPIDPADMISISSSCDNLETLLTELSTPFRAFSRNGKTMVERKEDMLKRGVKSPNLADAFISAYSPMETGLFGML